MLIGSRNGGGTVQTSSSCTATSAGMTAPITYSWTFVSGDSTVTPVNSTAQATQFTGFVVLGTSLTATYICVATDSIGSVNSNEVTVILQSVNSGGDGSVVVP